MLDRVEVGADEAVPEWVRSVVDNVEDTRGLNDALVAQLAQLRRVVADCERALAFSAAMRQLIASDDSECPVCLERYTVAAVMPCLHATCRSCMRTHAGGASSFRCPLCRVGVPRAEVITFTKAPPALPQAALQMARCLPMASQAAPDAPSAVVAPDTRAQVGAEAPREAVLTAAAVSSRIHALVALLRSLLASGPDERVLVFAQWAAHVDHLACVLATAGVPSLTLGSSLPQSMAALQAFGRPNQPRVLLMSSQRHASGINLHMARHVVIVHPYCTPTARSARQISLGELASYERQAVGRVRRFPQTRLVEVYRFVAPGTIEEEVYAGRIQRA